MSYQRAALSLVCFLGLQLLIGCAKYSREVIVEGSDGKFESHQMAKKGEWLEWVPPDNGSYWIVFNTAGVCTNPDNSPVDNDFLASNGKPARCKVVNLKQEEGYMITDKNPLQNPTPPQPPTKQPAPPPAPMPAGGQHCNGCLVDPDSGQ